MAWEYKRESSDFPEIPVGDYRMRIRSAEKAVSKAGNDMIVIQLDVSGQTGILFHHIPFLNDYPEITNRNLTKLFDSFSDIPDGDFNLANWVGKVGAGRVKHDDSGRAKVHYFIKAKYAANLPPWKEPPRNGGQTTAEKEPEAHPIGEGFQKADDDIPFF